jgi:hypothetical protein
MRKKMRLPLVLLVVMALLVPLTARAAVVGHFTRVRGQVDLMKGGKLPAKTVKVKDGVEPGDIIRTKSKAKAELTMVDNSVIVMAPESRLAVADYVYNPAKNERRAVIRLFRGLVHTVVNRIIQTEQPDFIMETHTATVGVRGTDFYGLLTPSDTAVFLKEGTLEVSSNILTISVVVTLHSRQFTQVPMGKKPFPAKPLTMQMLSHLERLMDKGLKAGGLLGPHGLKLPEGSQNLQLPGFPGTQEHRLRQEYIPPVLQPQRQMPAPSHSPSPLY